MLRSLTDIFKYEINATDDNLGKVHDFYFDDWEWRVRYLIADTGDWLPGRRVLLSPVAIDSVDWAARQVHVKLTRKQIERSPGVETHEPVSRQKEKELTGYYGWPVYWSAYVTEGALNLGDPLALRTAKQIEESSDAESTEKGDSTLRSTKEVTGYHIEASDGEIGHVEDFIVDEDDWTIRYVVVDTRNWLPGKKVLIALWMIRSVSWDEAKVHLQMTRDQVQAAPEFDPSAPVNREFEAQFYDYFGRPVYWS